MSSLGVRDEFGLKRVVYCADGTTGSSVGSLLKRRPDLPRLLDVEGLRCQLARSADLSRTLLRCIRELPPAHALHTTAAGGASAAGQGLVVVEAPQCPVAGDLPTLLQAAVSRQFQRGKSVAVALSGGLDSAMVLGWARMCAEVTAYVLAPRMVGYSEVDAAVRTAQVLGAVVKIIEVDAADFRGALGAAVTAVEVPLYNAHPVAKLLLAQAMKADGVDVCLSGDGADHVMQRDRSANYLPLVHALFDVAGVELCSPFLDTDVVAHLLTLPPDRGKGVLREIAHTLGVPHPLVAGAKVSRLAPPIGVDLVVDPAQLARLRLLLSRGTGVPTNPWSDDAWSDDAGLMLWSTAALLLENFDLWPA